MSVQGDQQLLINICKIISIKQHNIGFPPRKTKIDGRLLDEHGTGDSEESAYADTHAMDLIWSQGELSCGLDRTRLYVL
jgi:hypothetical protein